MQQDQLIPIFLWLPETVRNLHSLKQAMRCKSDSEIVNPESVETCDKIG